MSPKFVWLAVLAMAPAAAHAFDLTPDTTRILSDPAFLPLKGQLSGETTYSYLDLSEDRVLPNGVTSPHVSGRRDSVGQSLSFGLTDRFSVNASMNYAEQRDKDTYPFGIFDFYSAGFNNPTIGATYRAIEQGATPVSIDISANYSPDVFAARAASTSRGGTVASGGQSEGVTIAASREMKSLTLQLSAGATYFGDRKMAETADNSTMTVGANWNYRVNLLTQTRLTERLFVNAGAGYSSQTDTTASDPFEGISNTNSFNPTLTTYIAPGYQVIPNRLVLSVEYDRDYPGVQTQSGSVGVWKNQVENLYAAHARCLFF